MRSLLIGFAILALPAAALAQMDGGGMGGMEGGMGGGMGGGAGGGMHGGHHRGGESGPAAENGGARHREMKPISRDKMDKPVTEMFQEADLDKDGYVTLDELNAVIDRKRDAIIHQRFEKIDTNHNKVIDEQEFTAWQAAMGSAAASDEDARGGDLEMVPETLSPRLGNSAQDMALRQIIAPLSATVLVDANTNYDKGVSLTELLAYEHRRFDKADTNKDGELSEEELRSLMPKGRFHRERGIGGHGEPQRSPPSSADTPSPP